jgi:hypothetical protein
MLEVASVTQFISDELILSIKLKVMSQFDRPISSVKKSGQAQAQPTWFRLGFIFARIF